VDRAKVGFLAAIALGGLAYMGLVYTMPHPWRAVCTLAPMVLILAIVLARVLRGHWEYKLEKLRRQPIAAEPYMGHAGQGRGDVVVKPVFTGKSPGGRFVLR